MTLVAAVSGPAAASPPGTQTLDRSATLQTSNQSMFGSGIAAGPSDQNYTLFDQSWNVGGTFGGKTHVSFPLGFDPTPSVYLCDPFTDYGDPFSSGFGESDDDDCSNVDATSADDNIVFDIGDFGASVTAHTQGEIGMSVNLGGFDHGSLGVTYPITGHHTVPQPDSFAPGDTVTIDTSMSVGAAAIQSTFPSLTSIGLAGKFGFHADASGELCVFKCTSGSVFDLSIPDHGGYTGPASGDLFNFPIHGTGCFNFLVNFPLGFGTYPNTRCNNNGYIEPPNVSLTSSVHADGSVTGMGTDTYAIVPVSAVTWAGRLAGLGPVPLNLGPVEIPGTGITVGWTTANLIFSVLESMSQNIAFTPQVNETLSWPQSAHWVVRDASNGIVSSGDGMSATFPIGDKLELTTPSNLTGAFNVTPTFSMGSSTVTNQTKNTTTGAGEFKVLSFTLKTPKATANLDFLGTVTVWPGTNIDAGPLVDVPFPLGSTDNQVANSSFTLGGFNSPAADALPLVPDLPPVAATRTITPTEGAAFSGTVSTFADPDPSGAAADYTATIDWGDGSTGTGQVTGSGGALTVGGSHTYAEEGPYPITVVLTDVDTPTLKASAISHASVADAALHAVGRATNTASDGTPILLWPTPATTDVLATFTDDDPAGAVADYTASVDWGDGSTSTGVVSVNAGGGFKVTGTHGYVVQGPHLVRVRINDVGGSTVLATTTAMAFGYATGGSFVVGNVSAGLGKSVTFWGAQWSKENSLSGGAGPASFKGFANMPTSIASCGATWSTSPGNSSGPPATVPSYVAVVSAGSVSSSGSTIRGNAPGIVVVRVDPGYGPSPGHAGTGTVVAVICH